MKPSTPSGEPNDSATPTSTSSTRPRRRGLVRKVRRDGKTVLIGPMLPPMPKHVKEHIQRYMDDRFFDPPMPPRYRALHEKDESEDTDGR